VTVVALRGSAMLLLIALLLFLAAGTTDWPFAWAYLGVLLVASILSVPLILRRHPGLVEERMRGERKEGAKGWDRALAVAFGVATAAVWVVAGLDRRFGWSPRPGTVLGVVALVAGSLGAALSFWAMMANPFFSAVVRIQRDRDHRVVSAGPYGTVRHPGYAGAIVANLAIPVVLGSRWALAIGVLIVVLILVRTALEDRTLRGELEGYGAYAALVRWRLLPGVW
jgi:protein-S-isoprenylcysteine O-methyltransferase Ste14